MAVLVLAEHDNHALHGATLSAVAAAGRLALPITVLVAGEGCHAVAQSAACLPGVERVWLAQAPHLAPQLAEGLAAQVLAVSAGFTHMVAAATAVGKSVMPRVAAKLNVAQVSEVIAIESLDTFVRPIYAGNALATVRATDAIKVLTIRAAAFAPVATDGGAGVIETVAAVLDPGGTRFVNRACPSFGRPELAGARVVVAGGRGLGSAENFKLLETLADRLGAALGASRAAVDAGFAPNDWQVGQTGKIVAPQLYVAIGISGATQHLAGMKDSKVIVAINKDPEAPIFSVADYGLVGDLFALVPELIAQL